MEPLFNSDLSLQQPGLGLLSNKQAKPSPAEGGTGDLLGNFSTLLRDRLEGVDAAQKQAEAMVADYAVGRPVELHEVVASVEQAQLSLEMATLVRNKLVNAYQELTHLQF